MKFRNVLAIILSTCGVIVSYADDLPNNQICLGGAGFDVGNVTEIAYSITPGQTMGGVYMNSEQLDCLDIKATRKRSTTPVEWVKNDMVANGISFDSTHMVHSGISVDSTPDKLNFVVKLNVVLKYLKTGVAYTRAAIYI